MSGLGPTEDRSVDGICDDWTYSSGGADPAAPPDLLIEIPHGATTAGDYARLRRRLSGEYPQDLQQFFFVNTDVGAPEAGQWIARSVVAGAMPRKVRLLRSRIPRTFIDCNREVDYRREEGDASRLTPGLPEYVTHADDRALLARQHRDYHDVAESAYAESCGAGGLALCLHTYAPKAVEIYKLDDGIVSALHEAYRPDAYARWSLRPEVDIISESEDATRLAPVELVEYVVGAYREIGIEATENRSYRLHPGSMGYRYSTRHPGRVICIELRRELLVEAFTPFEEMRGDERKVARMSAPIADSLMRMLDAPPSGRRAVG